MSASSGTHSCGFISNVEKLCPVINERLSLEDLGRGGGIDSNMILLCFGV